MRCYRLGPSWSMLLRCVLAHIRVSMSPPAMFGLGSGLTFTTNTVATLLAGATLVGWSQPWPLPCRPCSKRPSDGSLPKRFLL
jgi:hypothetical protein